MRLDRNDKVNGVPIKAVRDLLLSFGSGGVDREYIKHKIGTDITDVLLTKGWIEQRGEHEGKPYYGTMVAGDAVGNAHFVKPLPRANVNILVDELLCRADAINSNDDLLYRVKRIRAFGSYITDAPDVGDIDLVVELKFKKAKGDVVKANTARAEASGKTLGFIDTLCYGEIEVKRLLKARSPYLSLHSETQIETLGCGSLVLYPRPAGYVAPDYVPRRRR